MHDVILAALLLSVAPTTYAQEWEAYGPGQIADVVEENLTSVLQTDHGTPYWTISGNSFPRRATLQYMGESRPIGEIRREVIRRWAKAFRRPELMVDMFDREYLFRENGVDYWMPVQTKVAAYFDDELTVGGPVELFVAWLGAHDAGEGVTWVFIVNEFTAP